MFSFNNLKFEVIFTIKILNIKKTFQAVLSQSNIQRILLSSTILIGYIVKESTCHTPIQYTTLILFFKF